MTGAAHLASGAARLRAAGIADPMRDARRLLAHALGVAPGRLTLVAPDEVPAPAAARFDRAIAARCRRQPVAQITGWRAFFGREFIVTPDVLDPRPETETLVAALRARPGGRVLDIGTGSGCLLLTLLAEWPEARGVGTDASATALSVARRNAIAHGLARRAGFRRTDWAAGIEGPFDVIVSNPPYLAASEIAGLDADVRDWEPRAALTPGADPLAAYAALLPQAAALLAPGGRVVVEMAPWQAADVDAIGRAAGLAAGRVLPDADGRPRAVAFGDP